MSMNTSWTIINDTQIIKNNKVYVLCRCKCGVEKEVILKNIKTGRSMSCGCVGKSKLLKRNTKHGKRFTKEWRAWQAMKNRCYNKKLAHYKNYGGRGIEVCDEWLNNFEAFYKHVGNSPKGTSLDRIDNNGNYEPGNVRWATKKEQAQNRNTNNKIKGVCITEISKSLGGGHALVAKRLKRGWLIERAISEKTHVI